MPDVKMIVTGWGTTSAERKFHRFKLNFGIFYCIFTFGFFKCLESVKSNELLKTQVKTMPLEECNDTMTFYNLLVNLPAFRDGISQSQYCAYDPQNGNDSCQGDSGGPLQFFADSNVGVATIVGIVSFGLDCGAELPSIYTRVAYYLDWIEPIVWPNL